MAELAMPCRDIWVKYTDKNGKTHVAYHRVWDVGLFMAKREEEVKKDGGKVEQVMQPERAKRT